jgi:hypothetical protein
MYSDKEVCDDLELLYKFLKKYGEEETLVYLHDRIDDYKKQEGDL